jgi:hypothetical protein
MEPIRWHRRETSPKEPLLVLVKERVSDRTVLELMQRFLEQDVMEGMKRWTPIAGTPQGSVISPLTDLPPAGRRNSTVVICIY